MKKDIEKLNHESQIKLNDLLLDEFNNLKIKYEEKQLTGKAKKRGLTAKDIEVLKPFHWGYHFDKILKNGVDAIITNPPWEIFKPQAKEFFAEYSDLVTKNKMDIKTFEKQQQKLLANPEIAEAWLKYQSQYPYVSAYYRSSEDYKNQISIVNGKKAGTDINLYKLFLERCFHLLKDKGECGIVIPSGIYTDLGTKQLREMLFSQTKVTGLFCLENRKEVFEGVHRSFKIVVLTFEKNGTTTEFPSAFMRLDVNELQRFPSQESLRIDVDLVRKLSPDSLSVMEFKNEIDIRIAQKMLKFPLLGEKIDSKWNLRLTREFDMTNDSHLYYKEKKIGMFPLYEGKMFHQFTYKWNKPKYWVNEKEAAKELLSKRKKSVDKIAKKLGIKIPDTVHLSLDYKSYRLAFRDVAASTNERSMIMTILPPNVFCPHTVTLEQVYDTCVEHGHINPNNKILSNAERFFICAFMNSFIVDSYLRQRITNHLSFFFIYGTPIPRLTKTDRHFTEIVQRAAKLICTTPEFDELARDVGLNSHKNGVTDECDRAQLRAELDGIIAHLYGLTEGEFGYILSTFPIVAEETKQAALSAYRALIPNSSEVVISSPVN